jgi:hypothetical protein
VNRIAFVGKMHAGKTTSASFLVKRGYEKLSFATPVKKITEKMLNTFAQEVFGPDHPYVEVNDDTKNDPAIRGLAQFVGTQLGRQWTGNENLWCDIAEAKIIPYDPHRLWVVDDCRFWNEHAMLKRNGFIIIRVTRPESDRMESIMRELERKTPTDSVDTRREKLFNILAHESEQLADDFDVDYEFDARNPKGIEEHIGVLVGELEHASIR